MTGSRTSFVRISMPLFLKCFVFLLSISSVALFDSSITLFWSILLHNIFTFPGPFNDVFVFTITAPVLTIMGYFSFPFCLFLPISLFFCNYLLFLLFSWWCFRGLLGSRFCCTFHGILALPLIIHFINLSYCSRFAHIKVLFVPVYIIFQLAPDLGGLSLRFLLFFLWQLTTQLSWRTRFSISLLIPLVHLLFHLTT